MLRLILRLLRRLFPRRTRKKLWKRGGSWTYVDVPDPVKKDSCD